MIQRRYISLVAAAATLLATAPLITVFTNLTWTIDALLAVAAVTGAAVLARYLRSPLWGQVVAMCVALVVMVTWLFGAGTALAGTLPGPATLRHYGELITSAGEDIRGLGVPVPDRPGLLFLTTLGVGGVAILVDLFVVGLRRPALAGLPMLPLYSIPVMVHVDSVMFLTFVVAASGYLWLLASDSVDRVRRFGRRFTGEGRDVDIWEPSPLAAAGRRLAAVGVLAAVLVPLAVPGLGSGLISGIGAGGDGFPDGPGNGRGTTINLFAQLSDRLNQQKSFDMVKVTTTEDKPFYLRFGVADQLDVTGFKTRIPQGGRSVTNGLPDPTITSSGVLQHRHTAQVDILDLTMPLLPTYSDPVRIQGLDARWGYDAVGKLLYSTQSLSSNKKYTMEYVRPEFSVDALRRVPMPAATDEMVREFTSVPDVLYVRNVVNGLIGTTNNEYDAMLALFAYFSHDNGFNYALSTKKGTSGSDIVDFLTNKTGYCTQYAAALAWMARQAGIPARVVFGFTRGNSRVGLTWALANTNLHAWTEVYFAGYGWVPFDATPAAGVAGSVSSVWAPDVNSTASPGTDPSASAGTDPSGLGASGPARNPDADPLGGGAAGLPVTNGGTPTWVWVLLGATVLLLVLLAMPVIGRAELRRRRIRGLAGLRGRSRTEPEPGGMVVLADPTGTDADSARRAAHAAWDEIADTLTDYRVPVDEAETPRVTITRVIDRMALRGAPARSAELVARAEERARYARAPLAGVDLAGAVRELHQALRARVSRRTRIQAVLFPRSVLLRLRVRAGRVAVAGQQRWAQASDRALRLASPRRLLANRSRD